MYIGPARSPCRTTTVPSATASGSSSASSRCRASGGRRVKGVKCRKKFSSLRCLICSSKYCRMPGLWRTRASKTDLSRRSVETSLDARTVAVRVEWSSRPISPKLSPGRRVASAISSPCSAFLTMRALPETSTKKESASSPSRTIVSPNEKSTGTKLLVTSARASPGKNRRIGRSSSTERSSTLSSPRARLQPIVPAHARLRLAFDQSRQERVRGKLPEVRVFLGRHGSFADVKQMEAVFQRKRAEQLPGLRAEQMGSKIGIRLAQVQAGGFDWHTGSRRHGFERLAVLTQTKRRFARCLLAREANVPQVEPNPVETVPFQLLPDRGRCQQVPRNALESELETGQLLQLLAGLGSQELGEARLSERIGKRAEEAFQAELRSCVFAVVAGSGSSFAEGGAAGQCFGKARQLSGADGFGPDVFGHVCVRRRIPSQNLIDVFGAALPEKGSLEVTHPILDRQVPALEPRLHVFGGLEIPSVAKLFTGRVEVLVGRRLVGVFGLLNERQAAADLFGERPPVAAKDGRDDDVPPEILTRADGEGLTGQHSAHFFAAGGGSRARGDYIRARTAQELPKGPAPRSCRRVPLGPRTRLWVSF